MTTFVTGAFFVTMHGHNSHNWALTLDRLLLRPAAWRRPLVQMDLHRLDGTSFAWRTHSITSSASARKLDGKSMPVALAVLRLMTSR